ncbi:hypothetical protein, partial [Vibrio harveyi]|uniref:hypothetical protein n=1 Tax=Vibrio harveyi TaxID=669 RepID=UPI0006477756
FKSPPRLQTKSSSLNLASRGYLGIEHRLKTKRIQMLISKKITKNNNINNKFVDMQKLRFK